MDKYGKLKTIGYVQKDHKDDKYYPHRKQLGEKIKELRLAHGWTQEEFAMDTVGINVSYLAKIENGYINTSLRYMIIIADGLEVKVRDLIEF